MHCRVQSTTGKQDRRSRHVRRLLVPSQVVRKRARKLETPVRNLHRHRFRRRAASRLRVQSSHFGGIDPSVCSALAIRRRLDQQDAGVVDEEERRRVRVVRAAGRLPDDVRRTAIPARRCRRASSADRRASPVRSGPVETMRIASSSGLRGAGLVRAGVAEAGGRQETSRARSAACAVRRAPT